MSLDPMCLFCGNYIKRVQYLYKIYTSNDNFYTIKIYIICITFFKIYDLLMLHTENQPRYKIYNMVLKLK